MFALTAHGAQLYGTEPYIVHLDEVYGILVGLGLADGPLGTAAFLHDVVEDTKVTRADIEEAFGEEVAKLVWAVTGIGRDRKGKSRSQFRKIQILGDDAATLKLADRLCNVRRSKANRPDLFAMYQAEQPAFSAALEENGLGDPRLWKMLAEAFDA